MIDKTPDVMQRLWQEIPTGQAPIAKILADGQRLRRRRRRAVATATTAAVVLVVVGGLATAQYSVGTDSTDGNGLAADRPNGTTPEPPSQDSTEVPAVVGLKVNRAVRLLEESGLVAMVDQAACGPAARCVDEVTAASPEPGRRVDIGSAVTITASVPSADPGGVSSNDVALKGTWRVSALVSENGDSLLAGAYADQLQLTFDAGRMTGTSGCNDISAVYATEGRDLRVNRESMSSTAVGCEEPPLAARLLDVRHISRSGDTVYLHAEDWMIVVALTRG